MCQADNFSSLLMIVLLNLQYYTTNLSFYGIEKLSTVNLLFTYPRSVYTEYTQMPQLCLYCKDDGLHPMDFEK